MSGDYTRFSFDPRNRYSGVLMQQGRVQLDSDWNEEIDILRRRIRTTTLDILGPVGVPYVVSPSAFNIGLLPGAPADLSIGPGRLYVDGLQIEAFAEEAATYRTQPFFPQPLDPALELPGAGDVVVYLDVWDREVTYIEDPDLLDVALGGADTTTRRQTIWQVRVEAVDNAACGVPVGDPPSAGRLTSRAVAPPDPDDPCILPPASGYRGLENRLYRVEVHNGGALGAARFKWSRDNGSIVSVVRDIAVSGAQTTLSVNRIGRDRFLRFRAGDWVTVSDDHRDWMGETGDMALIVNIDETNRQIVLDRALPTGRPFGANAGEHAVRHTRVQRWDQTGATNTVDTDGLVLTAAGPIPIEDGIEIQFSTDPAGGAFRAGDYWAFWARTATATIEELTNAPPRGIIHHYAQLAAINGLGGANPVVTDCRPPPPQQGAGDCCCTIIVRPGENIQAGIDALPAQGGCVCLKTGLHVIQEPLRIARGSIVLEAESPGTTVQSLGDGPALRIGNPAGFRIEGIDVLGIDFEATGRGRDGEGVVMIVGAERVRVSHCGMSADRPETYVGLHAIATDRLSVLSCRFRQLTVGVFVHERCAGFEADSNVVELEGRERGEAAIAGIAYLESAFPCRISRNVISGALFGILLNDDPRRGPLSLAELSIVEDNFIICPDVTEPPGDFGRPVAIDVAAGGCTISGNRIRYESRLFIGIRVTGTACEVSGNQIASRAKEFDILGPIAIAMGFAQGENTPFVAGGVVAHNVIIGVQFGIFCHNAAFLVVEGNLIGTPSSFAILGTRVSASLISNNRIAGAASAILLDGGQQNRIAANDCRLCVGGIWLFDETGPQVTGNRLDQIGFWGIFAFQVAARLDIVENRLVGCARQASVVAFAIGCVGVAGEANISNNEIMDTGSAGEQVTAVPDYGIYGDLVLEARIEGNLVTYSNVLARNPQREDRALVMRGLFEFSQGNNELTIGFAIQILGNKFIGNGRTALVELREFRLNDRFFVRFERVSFDHNYCSHVTAPVFAPGQAATVWLVGRSAIVMGNHIKSIPLSFPSVNFNGMPGPFIGNITAGGTLPRGANELPTPSAGFNLTTN